MINLHHGDCLEVLASMPDACVDAVVTDPPYGLSFMGRKWDYDVPSKEIWEQCLRVLKPGGHLLAFAGTRTQHRMAVNIEDAGFEIRDMIMWCYSSGFPKSHNISKAIDKAAGAKREVIGKTIGKGGQNLNQLSRPHGLDSETASSVGAYGIGARQVNIEIDITAPATPEAQQWDGWGTALKPALEPITVARKPFKGNVANNVLTHGTGAINIDGCRVGDSNGRWPANLIHDGSDEVTELFPYCKPATGRTERADRSFAPGTDYQTGTAALERDEVHKDDSGSAARFFYCAKANKKDREDGNSHPTVKPTDLMAYLCRLVTPPDGIVLDPFMGSGSTGKAAVREGFSFIGIERDEEYFEIASSRVATPKQAQLALIA